jgi:AcrR family transcriptional regulator
MEMSRRELNKINCRKRILRASRRLFSTKGYEETMIEDIAKKAEISKATVYNYFPNKESLLIGTADEVLDRVRQMGREECIDCSSEKKLRRALEEIVTASVDYITLSRRITFLNSCEDNALFATHREMNEILRELIVKVQQEGIFRADADPDDIVDVVMGIYMIAQFQWPHVDSYSREFLLEKLNRFFTVMLSAYYA